MSTPDPRERTTLDIPEVDEALSPAPRLLPLQTLARSSAINAVFLVLQSIVFLVFTRVAFRILGPDLYGLWTVLFAIQTVSVVATLGIPQAATKFAAQFGTIDGDREQVGETVAATYVLLLAAGSIAALSVAVGRNFIAGGLVPAAQQRELAGGIGFLAPAFVPTFIHQGSRALLLAKFRNGLVGFLDLVQSAVLASGVVVLALRHVITARELGLWITVVALATSATSLACVYTTFRGSPRPRLTTSGVRASLRYGFFAWIAVLGSMLFDGGDRLVVSHLLGPTLAGAYGIATGVAMRLTQLNTPGTLLLSPFVSSHEAGNRLDTVARALRLTNVAVASLLAAAGAVLLLWTREILTIWITPSFATDYVPMFAVLVLVYATFSVAGPGYQTLLGLGRVRLLALLGVIGSVGTLVTMAALAPACGVLGAAFANAAYLTVLVASFSAAKAVGLRPGRTLLEDVGIPLGLLYFAACISLLQVGALERANATVIVLIGLGFHAWRVFGSGRGRAAR